MFTTKGRHRRSRQVPSAVLATVFLLAALPMFFSGSPR